MAKCDINLEKDMRADILKELIVDSPDMTIKEANIIADTIVTNISNYPTSFGATKESDTTESNEPLVVAANMINNPRKQLEVFEELLKYDSTKISKEHETLLRNTLTEITDSTDKALPEMIQVVSKGMGKNSGRLVINKTKDNDKEIGIYIGVSKTVPKSGNQMSAAEMYVHELSHGLQEFVLRDKSVFVAETMKDIQVVYDSFLSVVDYTDFLPERSIDLVSERQIAEELVDYLRDPVVGINEFMVRVKSDIRIKKILEEKVNIELKQQKGKTLYEKLKALVANIYNTFRNKARSNVDNETGYEAMERYLAEIANINSISAQELIESKGIASQAAKFMDHLNDISSKKLESYVAKLQIKVGTEESKKLQEDIDKLLDKENPLNKLEKANVVRKIFTSWLLTNEIASVGAFETWLGEVPGKLLSGYGIEALQPQGDVQQIMRGFRQSDNHAYNIEKLGVISNKIDHAINAATASMSEVIKAIMPLTDAESVDITKGLIDIDFESMLDPTLEGGAKKNFDTLVNVLKDRNTLEDEIISTEQKIEDILESDELGNIAAHQAKGLGRYMVSGNAGIAQLPNSYMIYGMLESTSHNLIEYRNKTPKAKKAMALIDKLAVLEAIKTNDLALNTRVATLIKGNSVALAKFANHNKMIHNQFKKMETFNGQYNLNTVKGHHQKINADWITYKVGKNDSETTKKMLEDNYVKDEKMAHSEDYAVYINTKYTASGYKPGAVSITNDSAALNSYINIFKEDLVQEEDRFNEQAQKIARELVKVELLNKNREVKQELELMKLDSYTPTSTGTRPIFNVDYHGEIYVTDLDITVDKFQLETVLRTKNKVETVFAKSFARAVDIEMSKENNNKVLDEIELNAEQNYTEGRSVGKKDHMKYTKIGPAEDNHLSKEIWGSLSRYVKTEIIKRSQNRRNKEIAKLAEDVGFYGNEKTDILEEQIKEEYTNVHPDVGRLLRLHKEVNKIYGDNLRKILRKRPELTSVVEKLSELYQANPALPVRTNQVYHALGNREATLFGADIQKTLAKKHPKLTGAMKTLDMIWKHLIKELKTTLVVRDVIVLAFNILSNMLLAVLQRRNPLREAKLQFDGMRFLDAYLKAESELQQLQIKLKSGVATTAERNRAKQLANAINKNTVKPLIDAGLYTSTTEDISNTDLHKETYIDFKLGEYTDKIPQGVKDVLSTVYLGKESAGFKDLLRIMQDSDFSSRYSAYYSMIAKGTPKHVALKEILDNQINYNHKSGKILQWFEDRGGLMFTKFLLRIQKVISKTTLKNPINVLLAVISGGLMFEDSPLGDSLLARDFSDSMHGPFGLIGSGMDIVTMPALLDNILTIGDKVT